MTTNAAVHAVEEPSHLELVRGLDPLDRYFYWCVERHQIYLRRLRGQPRPWTDDEILRDYYFTNPYRELDWTTAWFREHVRDPRRDDSSVVFATVAARWFNYIPTMQLLLECGALDDWGAADRTELFARRDRGEQVFTGAFMINSPPGQPKLEAVCRRITNVWNRRRHLQLLALDWMRLSAAHADLLRYDGLGGFMAYEIACDLRYTWCLENATDINTWANPGPGATRGLLRLLGREHEIKNNSSAPKVPAEWGRKLIELRALLDARMQATFGADAPPIEAREVEHSLCEWDKYERLLWGHGTAKRRYPGA